jgi:hypothetical protein
VAADVGLAINPSVGSPEELLSLVRAKEVAQALLADVIVKKAATTSEGAGIAQAPRPEGLSSAVPLTLDVPMMQEGMVITPKCGGSPQYNSISI